MTPKEVLEDKTPISWPLKVVTSFYILKPTKQARFSGKMSNTIGSHGLYVSFRQFYVSFWPLSIRYFIEDTQSFKNCVAVLLYGLVKYPTDVVYYTRQRLVRKNKYD